MMSRQRSLALNLDAIFQDAAAEVSPVRRTEVLAALLAAGVPKESIVGIEANQRNKYFIVFQTKSQRFTNIDKEITIREQCFKLKHPDPNYGMYGNQKKPKTRVRIYGYPLDAPINHLDKHLRQYGSYHSITDMVDRECDLYTGIRQVYMDREKSIPSFIYIGPHLVRVAYDGQTKTCRKCHQPDHLAKDCQAKVTCKSCGSDTHGKRDCPEIVCYYCGERGHYESNCPTYEVDYPPFKPTEIPDGGDWVNPQPLSQNTFMENEDLQERMGKDWSDQSQVETDWSNENTSNETEKTEKRKPTETATTESDKDSMELNVKDAETRPLTETAISTTIPPKTTESKESEDSMETEKEKNEGKIPPKSTPKSTENKKSEESMEIEKEKTEEKLPPKSPEETKGNTRESTSSSGNESGNDTMTESNPAGTRKRKAKTRHKSRAKVSFAKQRNPFYHK